MPIRINSASDIVTVNGGMTPTLQSASTVFSGTATPTVDITGSFNRTLQNATASFVDSDLFPKVAGIIYDREWAEDSANGENWRDQMAKLDLIVVGLFPKGDWDSSNPTGLSRQAAYNDLIDRSKLNGPGIYGFDYTSVMEASISQSVQAELVDWIDNTTAFSGGVPGDWTANNFWLYNQGGNRINTFGGDPNVLNVNIGRGDPFPDLTDASGRTYSERYGDYILEYMFDPVNTNKQGGPGSIGPFLDVMGGNSKTNSGDWDADGTAESARSNWNDPSDPTGFASAGAFRSGFVRYLGRLRAKYSTMYAMGNWTDHLTNAYPGDPDNDAANSWVGTDLSRLPLVIPEYFQLCQAAYVENQNTGDFPESGVKSDGTLGGSGSWQRVFNRYVQAMLATAAPNMGVMDWKADLTPHGGANPNTFNPTGGPFHIMRWGLATCLMHDGYFHPHFAQSTFRTIAFIDELGIENTGTTGLSSKWLGKSVDPPQLAPAFGSNIYARRFDNGAVVLNILKDHTGSATTVNLSSDLGWGDSYETFQGVQDSSHNDGATKTSLSVKQADAYILRKV